MELAGAIWSGCFDGLHRREVPPLRKPARSQEANAKKERRLASVGMTSFSMGAHN
jgi:hypothetical protein